MQCNLSNREGRSMNQECHHPERTERPASEGDALQRDITSRDQVEEEVVQFASQPLHEIVDLQRTSYRVMCGRNQEITLFVTEGL
jgi:hypothetical protein